MKVYKDIVQKSPEWRELRAGKLTGSKATAIGNCGKGLITLADDIVREQIFGWTEGYVSKDMERGNNHEPLARLEYEFHTGNRVIEVGFIEHNEFVGVSPDGIVGVPMPDYIIGGVEIKCKNEKNHWEVLKTEKIDSGTMWQIQMNLLVSRANWWDFVSFNVNFKRSCYIQRVYPNQIQQQKLLKGFEMGEQFIRDLRKEKFVQYETDGNPEKVLQP